MNKFALLLLCNILLLNKIGIHALRCYDCNSVTDSRCFDDKPPDALKKDCSELRDGSKYTMCRKITQVIEFSVNGLPANTRVIRSCGWDESNYKGKCYQRGGFGGRQEVCSCTSDFCNGGSNNKFSFSLYYIWVLNIILIFVTL